jgi:bifunctional DNA-binding transcriptional regulator/antitoxin component of YhaV-PrlF toxin-antitoxin module
MSHKRKVVKIGHSFRLTIPTEIVEVLEYKEGDVMEISVIAGQMVVKKVEKKEEK